MFFVLACNTIKDSALDTEANNKRFTKRIETFKKLFSFVHTNILENFIYSGCECALKFL